MMTVYTRILRVSGEKPASVRTGVKIPSARIPPNLDRPAALRQGHRAPDAVIEVHHRQDGDNHGDAGLVQRRVPVVGAPRPRWWPDSLP